jgi:uncharacterized protein with von Willebrand factor type A (vWA) domain
MGELDDILWQVFERLRRQGVPIGVSEYIEAIKLIKAEFEPKVCRLLWAKSQEEQELFDSAFAELVEPQLQNYSPPEPTSPKSITLPSQDSHSPSTSPSQSTKSEPLSQPQTSKPQQTTVTSPATTETQLVIPQLELPKQTRHYQIIPSLPINKRDMAAAWRQLRLPQRVGVPEELDIEATIYSICRTGLLRRPIFQPRLRNQANLVVLLDQQGSMAPFALLIEALIESILRGGLLGKTSFYYFHDCPEGFFYQNPNLTRAKPLQVVLDEEAKGNSVLIISDAGAARGYYDSMRVKETKSFLQTLREYTYLYAWLNPMPKHRWKTTTAEDIASKVPMFPLNRDGLNDVVNILRGFPVQE